MFNSIASVNPMIVTPRAVNFRYNGIVICGTVIGVRLLEIMNPAKMLPNNRRLIGLIRCGLFSLIVIIVGNRGCPSNAKNIIRVL